MLQDYLTEEAKQAFSWGECDCATLAIGWADRATGLRHLQAWRGWYCDAETADAFVAGNGGFERIARAFVSLHYGFMPTDDASCGNVVLARIAAEPLMGVRVDTRHAAFRIENRGLWITRKFETLKEWTVPCRLSS